jgi:large repetitive protein
MQTTLLPLPYLLTRWCLISGLILLSDALMAQITIQKYPREITCDIDAITELPTIQAESLFGGLVVHLEEEIFSGGCLGTLVRTFHFEDKAGEKATAIQTVHLTDIMPPDLIGVPANLTVKKDEIPPVFPIDARDNSGQFCEVQFSEKQEGNKIFRTWSATDPCGNQNSATQVLTIR